MSIKSIDDLLGFSDLATTEVDTSEWWGESVYVRQFDAEAMGIFVGLSQGGQKNTFNVSDVAAVCALTMCDEKGELLVDRKAWQDSAKKLETRNFEALQVVYLAALKLSGLTKDEQEETEKK